MGEVLLDPTDRVDRGEKVFAPRLETLTGKTVGLLDINKSKGVYFLDRLEEVSGSGRRVIAPSDGSIVSSVVAMVMS